jgi:hypothetical protein
MDDGKRIEYPTRSAIDNVHPANGISANSTELAANLGLSGNYGFLPESNLPIICDFPGSKE